MPKRISVTNGSAPSTATTCCAITRTRSSGTIALNTITCLIMYTVYSFKRSFGSATPLRAGGMVRPPEAVGPSLSRRGRAAQAHGTEKQLLPCSRRDVRRSGKRCREYGAQHALVQESGDFL